MCCCVCFVLFCSLKIVFGQNWSHISDYTIQVNILYLNINFGRLNRNSMKNEMIKFIIL